jgi:two-component system response regulator HydG
MVDAPANHPGRVLVVDDDEDVCRLVEHGLSSRDIAVVWRCSAADALEALDDGDFDVVLTDFEMPDMDGLELCQRIVGDRPGLPVVVLTAFGDLATSVRAIRAGAYDFIMKPPELDTLTLAIERAVRHRRLQDEVKRLRHAVDDRNGFGGMIAASNGMRRVMSLVERVADADASVLIAGESGTGKELVARALHERGRRHRGPFVPVNCAAVPAALLESELFGHVRGAFTDARSDRVGLFARASGGTLFLDEITELPPVLQPKLLRFLQERTIRPVGSDAEEACDVRIVAATNEDVEAAVRARRFRQDLYFRVNVVRIDLPPLRARENDVLLLAQHFVQRYAARTGRPVVGLSPAAGARMLAYGWPGNVRELQNCIERAVALTPRDHIGVDDLPDAVRGAKPVRRSASGPVEPTSLAEVERRHVLAILASTRGNRKEAARILGLDRKTLYRRLLKYGAS